MTRLNNPVYKYFRCDDSENKGYCLIDGCIKRIVGGISSTHFKRHLSTFHPSIYNEEFGTSEENINSSENFLTDNSQCKNSLEDTPLKRGKKDIIRRSKECFEEIILDMITQHGIALTFFDSITYEKLSLFFNQAYMKNIPTINSKNIKKKLVNKANDVKENITQKLKNKLFFLKVDLCSRLNRSILGINAQYFDSNSKKIGVITLSQQETTLKHTALNISSLLSETLNKYNLSMMQVIGITTDNASNMIKSVDVINAKREDEFKTLRGLDDELEFFTNEYIENNGDNQENNELISIMDQVDEDLNNFCRFFQEDNNLVKIEHQRCIAHLLQLAIKDFLNYNNDIVALLERVRRLVKKLRTINYMNTLKELNKYLFPILDMVTRWGSTYKMLERILDLKVFVINHLSIEDKKIFDLTNNDWAEIEKLRTCLQPLFDLSIILQSEDLISPIFFRKWLLFKSKIIELNTSYSENLIYYLNSRESIFFENKIFLSGIFLDPVLKGKLTLKEKKTAIDYLRQLQIHLSYFENKFKHENDIHLLTSDNYDQYEEEDAIKNFRKDLDLVEYSSDDFEMKEFAIESTKTPNYKFKGILNSYLNYEKGLKGQTIIDFWLDNKVGFSELGRVALIIYGLPVTQVSVERNFSSLKFILSDLRYNLGEDLLNDILLIRLNKD